jgi:hypothetical protein
MPDYILVRLTPASAINPTPIMGYLANLTIKAYDISYDTPSAPAAQ